MGNTKTLHTEKEKTHLGNAVLWLLAFPGESSPGRWGAGEGGGGGGNAHTDSESAQNLFDSERKNHSFSCAPDGIRALDL